MVGWKRLATEEWSETMRRMRRKVEAALYTYPVKDWSDQHLHGQFRFACRVARKAGDWPARASRWQPRVSVLGAYRSQGRPLLRWDDRLSRFAKTKLDSATWPDAFTSPNILVQEDAYVSFHRRKA